MKQIILTDKGNQFIQAMDLIGEMIKNNYTFMLKKRFHTGDGYHYWAAIGRTGMARKMEIKGVGKDYETAIINLAKELRK